MEGQMEMLEDGAHVEAKRLGDGEAPLVQRFQRSEHDFRETELNFQHAGIFGRNRGAIQPKITAGRMAISGNE